MAIGKLIVVNHDTGAAFTGDIVIASFHNGLFIYIRKKFMNRRMDVVGSAKGTDNTIFRKRVLLLLFLAFEVLRFRCGSRELCYILPVRVGLKKFIWIEPLTLIAFADIFAILRTGRPVHELVHLKGAGIKHLHAHICAEVSCNRHALIRAYVPLKRNQDSCSWRFRCMAVGRIDNRLIWNGEFQLI